MLSVRPVLPAICIALAPGLAAAQDRQDQADALYDALRMGDVLAIMREEGLAYGDELEADLFPGRGGATWDSAVARIYDAERMEDEVREGFAEAIGGADMGEVVAFFEEPRGAEIIALELGAREALMDDAVEEAAREQAQALPGDRLDRIDTFIEVNDLVEQNVSGAMNANLAFYSGLAEGGAIMEGLSEGDMLDDVWAQAPAIRDDTIRWLYAYLGLAYAPLSDADFDAYIELSDTDAGQTLNAALFTALDDLYIDISRELGRAAAGYMQGEDI